MIVFIDFQGSPSALDDQADLSGRKAAHLLAETGRMKRVDQCRLQGNPVHQFAAGSPCRDVGSIATGKFPDAVRANLKSIHIFVSVN